MLQRIKAPEGIGEDQGEDSVFTAPKKKDFLAIIRDKRKADKAMSGERSSIGGTVADFVENKKGHKRALAMAYSLDRLMQRKDSKGGALVVAELMFHFKLYCEWLGIDEALKNAPQMPLGDREADEE